MTFFIPIFMKYKFGGYATARLRVPVSSSMKETIKRDMFHSNFAIVVFEGLNIIRV